MGDYNPEEHGPNYLSNIQLVIGQSDDIEKKISELHKLHKGQLPADAEFNFLDHAKRIDMYGVELHKAKVIKLITVIEFVSLMQHFSGQYEQGH